MEATEIISWSDAKSKGLKRYYTGEPCPHGHVTERQTSNGGCIGCRADAERRYKEKNPEKWREKTRRQASRHRQENPERINRNKRNWALRNPDKVREKCRNWRKNNPDRQRANDKRWRDARPEYISKKNRSYKQANKERLAPINRTRVKQWRKDHPEKITEYSQKRRARKKSVPGSHTGEQLKELFVKQGGKCAGCFIDLNRIKKHLDHIIPLSDQQRSSNDISNLQWLCAPCNHAKNAKDPIAWAQENGRLL